MKKLTRRNLAACINGMAILAIPLFILSGCGGGGGGGAVAPHGPITGSGGDGSGISGTAKPHPDTDVRVVYGGIGSNNTEVYHNSANVKIDVAAADAAFSKEFADRGGYAFAGVNDAELDAPIHSFTLVAVHTSANPDNVLFMAYPVTVEDSAILDGSVPPQLSFTLARVRNPDGSVAGYQAVGTNDNGAPISSVVSLDTSDSGLDADFHAILSGINDTKGLGVVTQQSANHMAVQMAKASGLLNN